MNQDIVQEEKKNLIENEAKKCVHWTTNERINGDTFF